jgi:hypothetical protein
MIRQLAIDGLKFRTPKYVISVEAYSERSRQYHRVDLPVTEEHLLILVKPEIDGKFSQTNVDVLGYVDDIPFIVYITYKDRLVPPEIDPPDIKKCGVVALDISGLPTFFESEREGRYIETLRKFIEESSEGKSWVYHPRAAKVRMLAEAQMEQWLSQQKADRLKARTAPTSGNFLPAQQLKPKTPMPAEHIVENYHCVICGANWRGISPHCKNCNTHLFSKVIN